MKPNLLFLLLFANIAAIAQSPVNLTAFRKTGPVKVIAQHQLVSVSWPAGKVISGKLVFNLTTSAPLFQHMMLGGKTIVSDIDPVFILNVGKRTLSPSSGGWDVFFDKVPSRPYQSYAVEFDKQKASIITEGSHTIIRIGSAGAGPFKGTLEITLYNGSPLFNIAAVMSSPQDSTAILYDAGLSSAKPAFNTMAWSDLKEQLQTAKILPHEPAKNLEVKYRTLIGAGNQGSLALFPAPHQYFYPLDEAFNLKFTWYGTNYRGLIPGFGMGIRQDPLGDKRYVPWFNAPPNTQQRLNFFCLLSAGQSAEALAGVKQFTNADRYQSLPGFKTMESHFHNEFVMSVVLAKKPVPDSPDFVKVFKKTGVDIVHLAEFHYTAHPKGPDNQRLVELKTLFEQCQRLSDKSFLLLPGEEPNEFYGGHWLSFFPKPVYWVMDRKPNIPFVSDDPQYGKIYHVGDKADLLKLMEVEHGLAWTAHARTKGSTGFPDAYKNESFFLFNTFLGAAWKAIPADLSLPTLSKRVLNLMDEMNNWGLKKHIISECDLFTIEPQNEMYAHMNVNYLQLDKLPEFKDGWQPVLDAIAQGKFFSSTGEVLIPAFTVNGKGSGETVQVDASGKATVSFHLQWTFPLNFAEVISGDGKNVYHERINLTTTESFGRKNITINLNLKGRTWVRLEAWDIAANGAFTQSIWLN